MSIKEKLQIIMKLSGLKQEKLAQKFKVTFASFNRWMNERSIPRKQKTELIDSFYLELTGQNNIPKDIIESKKQIIEKRGKEIKENVIKYILENNDIYREFMLDVTHNTNSIEGSTLSKDETEAILFDNVSIPNKTAREILETKNHQAAFEYLIDYLLKKGKIDISLIMKLHSILMNGILSDAGFYRKHSVIIGDFHVPIANFASVPDLMIKLIEKINQEEKDIIKHISEIHAKFEQIHPFPDGNGRIGRLLLIAQLLQRNLPPALIKQEDKIKYYNCLNRAQIKEDLSPLENFMCDAVMLGIDLYNRKVN
jgi:Fic family protein